MWEGIFAITRIFTAVITGVIGPVVIWWLKEYKKRDDDTSEEKDELSQDIESKLAEIRDETECDRIWVSQFHNGGRFIESIDHSSMKKMSVAYEKVNAGVSEEKEAFSNVLVSFFSEMIQKIIDEGHVQYDGTKMDVEPEAELLFRQRGTKRMYLFGMKDIDENLIGIMGVDYVVNDRMLNDEEKQYLTAKANLLAGYIYIIDD